MQRGLMLKAWEEEIANLTSYRGFEFVFNGAMTHGEGGGGEWTDGLKRMCEREKSMFLRHAQERWNDELNNPTWCWCNVLVILAVHKRKRVKDE